MHNIEVLHNIVIKHNIKDMITKSTLERIIGDDLSEIWKALTSDEKRVVTDNFKYERYKKNQMIYAESETPENLYCLLEGKVVLLVDNSPSAMILPTSIFDMIEEANDYYFPTMTNIYLKIARTLITIMTVFLTPVFLLFMQNLNWLPEVFSFIAVKDTVNIPLIFQLLILEIAIDGLRLAAMNTPSMLSTPLSVIAGLVMGEFSVQSGWFNSEVMLYMAFVSVANYTQPNFELGYALKFMRLELLILTALFNWWGFVIGTLIIVCSICFNKTLSGRNYLNVKLN